MTASPNPDPLLHGMMALALDAGRVILEFYDGGADVTLKPDASPVTSADLAAEAIILAGLQSLAPEIPVIAEEAVARGAIPKAARQFFLVDPLDGTKEFISRNGEFTVNIALIEAGQPVAGVVYAPAIGRLFWGEQGKGAAVVVVADPKAAQEPPREGRRIAAQQAAAGAPIKVVASRSHRDGETDRFLRPSAIARSCRPDRRSSSAWWRAARPSSIRGSAAPWNGTRRPAMRCWRRLAGRW